MCDTGAQEMLPNYRVVDGPQGDLTTDEVCTGYRRGDEERTCVANEKVIDQGKVQPAAWNMGRTL
jgi:hypothetical protein